MIDFRYHAISMVAVFLALAIGIVLGVTAGDSLVSEAEQGLRQSLQEDVVDAREASEAAAADLEQRDRVLQAMLPLVAGDRLAGDRVAIVGVGSLPEVIETTVRETVDEAGGRIDSVSVLPHTVEGSQLPGLVGGEAMSPAELGRRIAQAIVAGGRLAGRLQKTLPDRFAGDFAGADAVVLYREPGAEDAARAQQFASAVLDGLVATDARVVGVETSATDPSQIAFYTRHSISTVDSVDLPGGRAALVLVLAGAQGSFGFKESAEALLPAAAAGEVRTDAR